MRSFGTSSALARLVSFLARLVLFLTRLASFHSSRVSRDGGKLPLSGTVSMLSRSDGNDSFHANLSSYQVTISNKFYFTHALVFFVKAIGGDLFPAISGFA